MAGLIAAAAMPSRAATAAPASKNLPLILVVGDSLSAEYGLERGSGWVALLEQRLAQEKLAARVVNANISGDTTSGGRSRLPALLAQHRPSLVILELGGNDALRSLPLAATQANLTAMARAAKASGARVLVAGMQLPPNYGRRYADDFAAVFAKVAQGEGAAHSVRANLICPGFVRTPLVDRQIPEQAKALGISQDNVIKKVMLKETVDGEFTSVEDVAQVALMFAAFPSHGWFMQGAHARRRGAACA